MQRHKNNFEKAWAKIHRVKGKEIVIKDDDQTTIWTVVDEVEPTDEDLHYDRVFWAERGDIFIRFKAF